MPQISSGGLRTGVSAHVEKPLLLKLRVANIGQCLLAQSIGMLAGNAELRARLGAAARQTASAYTEAAFYARFNAMLDAL